MVRVRKRTLLEISGRAVRLLDDIREACALRLRVLRPGLLRRHGRRTGQHHAKAAGLHQMTRLDGQSHLKLLNPLRAKVMTTPPFSLREHPGRAVRSDRTRLAKTSPAGPLDRQSDGVGKEGVSTCK